MHNINNTRISKLTNVEILLQTETGAGLAIYHIGTGRTDIIDSHDKIGKDWAKRLITCHLAGYYLRKHARGFGDTSVIQDTMSTNTLS